MIESGAIIHAYVGEKRPNKEAIGHIVQKTLEETRCAQLVFSPTYTECDLCGNVMTGEKELCTNANCLNHSPHTVNPEKMYAVTRVVGYYSRLSHWNSSQRQIYKDRKKKEALYAGATGKNMTWLYTPSTSEAFEIIEFGKEGCPNCSLVKQQVMDKLKELGINKEVKFRVVNLDKADEKMLTEAVMYEVPFDTVPTLVIAGKGSYWKKTPVYSCAGGVCSAGMNKHVKEDPIKQEEI